MIKPQMTLSEYLRNNIGIVMITLTICDQQYQYNFWNIVENTIHFLKNDYSIGHILHNNSIIEQKDNSFLLINNSHPKNTVLNFYFGGSIN